MTTVSSDKGDAALRRALAEHAQRTGATAVTPADIKLVVRSPDPAPGIRAFRAWYREKGEPIVLAGIVTANGTPDVQPYRALGVIFQAWMAGTAPEAKAMAEVVTFVMAGPRETTAVLTEGDKSKLVRRPDERAKVGLPARIPAAEAFGVTFFWVVDDVPTHVRAFFDPRRQRGELVQTRLDKLP